MRRQSGKLRLSDLKATSGRVDRSAAVSDTGTAATADSKTDSGSKSKQVGGSFGDRLNDAGVNDVSDAYVFHSPLAERVKLRRMSQSADQSSSPESDACKTGSSKSKSTRSAAGIASRGTRNLLRRATETRTDNSANNNKSRNASVKKPARTVKLALMKKNSAIRTAVVSSKTAAVCTRKSAKPNAKRSVKQAGSSVRAQSRLAAGELKQPSEKLGRWTLKATTAVSQSGLAAVSRLRQKSVAPNVVQPKKSNSVKDLGTGTVQDAVKMPRLKANTKQNATTMTKKSMPVLQLETSLAESNQSAEKSPRKRERPSSTSVKSKSPKLSPVEETRHVAEKRGSLRNKDAQAETSSGDGDMPHLLAVELMVKTKPQRVTVGQTDCPPELDRLPLCDEEEVIYAEQKKPHCQLPARCPCDDRDAAMKTSPPSAKTVAEDISKNAAQKHSPARSKHLADLKPVSTCTALSQSNCSIPSQVAVTRTVCSVSSEHSMVAVMQTQCSASQHPVTMTWINCSTSSQPCTAALKQTGSDTGVTADSRPEDGYVCTVDSMQPSSEIVPYTHPTNSVSGQWQVPCGVPMAPFIITGMYPMMGSGYGCQMMSLPPLVAPAMPAASAIISARGSSLPSSSLQYSSYHLPAAPVVPLYMSPVVGPFMQPGVSSSQVNVMPFMPTLPHVAPAVHNQQSSATLVLRSSMLPRDQLYAVNCTLPTQQQVNLLLSGQSADGRRGRRNLET